MSYNRTLAIPRYFLARFTFTMFLAFSFFLIALLAKPAPSFGHDNGYIKGTVTGNTGPLSNIQVCLYSSNKWLYSDYLAACTTGYDGKYSFERLGGTSYKLYFFDGQDVFANQWYNDKPVAATADLVSVVKDQTTRADAYLQKAGRISGRVTNKLGKPIEGVWVMVDDVPSALYGSDSEWAFTDKNGYYVTNGLQAGKYKIEFKGFFADNTGGIRYNDEFYDGKTSSYTADPVAVSDNRDTTNINAVLTGTGAIEGKVTTKSGTPLKNITTDLYKLDSNNKVWSRCSSGFKTDTDGYFAFHMMSSGTYRLKYVDPKGYYQSQFYNDKKDVTAANDIVVHECLTTSNIDAKLVGPPLEGNINDGHGHTYNGVHVDHDLEGVKVELIKNPASLISTAYTDEYGNYSFDEDLEKTTYTVRMSLKSEDGRMLIRKLVTDVTFYRRFNSDPATNAKPVQVDFDLSDTAKIDNSSIDKGDLDNCGAVWYWLYKNYKLAKKLGFTFTYNCPTTLFENLGNCFWDSATGIHIPASMVDDDTTDDPYPPPWDYRKNRESHEFGHALWWNFMKTFPIHRSVANHAGYVNDDSSDSFFEGYAEFWTLYVADYYTMTERHAYDQWGDIVGRKRHAWDPINTLRPTVAVNAIPQEEFGVAGTLYDLYNPGGTVKMKLADIHDAIKATDTGVAGQHNMTRFYQQLLTRGVAPTTSLSPIFTSHGFFGDANGNWVYDAGEAIGAGNGTNFVMWFGGATYAFGPRVAREGRPFEQNSFVRVNLSESSGSLNSSSESTVNVAIHFSGSQAWDYSYDTIITGDSGLIYLPPLESGSSAVLTVKSPTGQESPDRTTISYSQCEAGRDKIASGAFTQTTFHVSAPAVPPNPSIISPKANSWNKGSLTLKANCPGTLDKVELWVDGAQNSSKSSSPYDFTLNTLSLNNGSHTVQLRSYNSNGYSESALNSIFVDNYKPALKLSAKGFSLKKPGATIKMTVTEFDKVKVNLTLRIFQGKKLIATLLNNVAKYAKGGTGQAFATKWNGKSSKKKLVKAGKYKVELAVIDAAGNRSVKTAYLTVRK